MKHFYDLNIPETSKPSDIVRYVQCGYTRLALNIIINVNEFNFEGDNKKLGKEAKLNVRSKFEKRLSIPDLNGLINDEVKEAASRMNCDIKIFSRLTLIAKDVKQLTLFEREFLLLIKQFEILACEVQSSDVLTYASNNMVIELLTFDLSDAVTMINQHILARCRDRNIAIEINLAAALSTTHGRVNTVKFLNELQLFRCPAILTMTSGARNHLLVRNHLGLSCIVSTMGLADKIVKEVNNNADKAVQRGLARKYTVLGSAAIVALTNIPGVVSVKVTANRESCESESPAKKRQRIQ